MVFSIPDPKNLDEARIAGLELDHAGWNELLLLEQAGLKRPHVIEFLKVKRINPLAEVELAAPDPGVIPIEPEVIEAAGLKAQEGEAPDPAILTVGEIEALELTPAQWAELLELEQTGKARKGVIDIAMNRAGV